MAEKLFEAMQAGRFFSRGKSRHSTRVISQWELIFVVSGTLDMFAGNSEYHLKAGNTLLLEANVKHGGLSDYAPDLSFYWLHFIPKNDEALKFIKNMPPCGVIGSQPRLIEYLQLYLSIQANTPEDSTARNIVFQLILHELGKHPSEPAAAAASPQARLAQEARRLIQLKYYTRISTSTLATELYCNADYLGRLYRENFHITITDDIHSMRMELVVKLLLTTQLSIKEIAGQAGYDDLVHFRKIFFRKFGMTPRQYRNLHIAGRANSE